MNTLSSSCKTSPNSTKCKHNDSMCMWMGLERIERRLSELCICSMRFYHWCKSRCCMMTVIICTLYISCLWNHSWIVSSLPSSPFSTAMAITRTFLKCRTEGFICNSNHNRILWRWWIFRTLRNSKNNCNLPIIRHNNSFACSKKCCVCIINSINLHFMMYQVNKWNHMIRIRWIKLIKCMTPLLFSLSKEWTRLKCFNKCKACKVKN